jgi:hypothetical protein
MKSLWKVFLLLLMMVILSSACAQPGTQAPQVEVEYQEEALDSGAPEAEEVPEAPAEEQAAADELADSSAVLQSSRPRTHRMIIKNAEISLLAADTDTAIDRTTQIVDDLGGYIISSRIWYEDWGAESYKYSTITIGVPVEAFESTLRRLRGIAVRVTDENASGKDVTDEFVDLESQLDNLKATRDRIKTFLDQAETVEEALTVNQELTEIEGQIEEIQGRMNYLKDRSSYSTITIHLNPDLPQLTPTPTRTPHPTATPVPWQPGETFREAGKTLTSIYQGLLDAAIWISVVILPIILPPLLLGYLVWLGLRGRFSQAEEEPADTKDPE